MTLKLPQGKSPTFLVVGGVIGAALLGVAWHLFSVGWFAAVVCLLAYEAWTFFNSYLNDTISEILWVLAKRPLIPFIFGAATVGMIEHGFFSTHHDGLYAAVIWGFLMGHFFFQRQEG